MWYGIGNTSLSNPSTMKVGIAADGALTLYSGAVDIGQGSNTIMVQICADALGVPVSSVRLVTGDTDLTEDAGKTSASRQTFVSGNALRLAGEDLRKQILRLGNVGEGATLALGPGKITLRDGPATRVIELATFAPNDRRDVLTGTGTFDPPTTPLDDDGQGPPHATPALAPPIAPAAARTAAG